MQKLLIATSNFGKLKAIKTALEDINIELLSFEDVPVDMTEFVEDGETFEENAIKKAKYAYEKTGITTLADDSGIFVNALANELGVKTRRWGAGENVSDEEWIEFFLNRMSEYEDKRAEFVTYIAVVGDKTTRVFSGITPGVITDKLMAPILKGLPLSSCFIPHGANNVFENLDAETKVKIGHRQKALNKVRDYLIETSS